MMGRTLAELDHGISRTVWWLREHGFDTTDSGDGRSKIEAGFDAEEVLDYPHVVCIVAPADLVTEANRLADLVHERGVEVVPNGRREAGQAEIAASYDPADDSAVLMLNHADDAMLFGDSAEQTAGSR
jgi:hypothetical protein